MKKSLFATTAIVAAFGLGSTAAQAQDASLTLGAYSDFYVGYTDQDAARAGSGLGRENYDFTTNSEVDVNGEVTLDNGITAGMSVQFEADVGSGGTIDENYIFLEGSFGLVEFGNEDGAHDTMYYGATNVKAVVPGTYNNSTGVATNYSFGAASQTPKLGDSSDQTKIAYFTPRFSGFQAGVSLAADDNNSTVRPSRNTFTGIPGSAALTEQIELGTNYVNSFNGVDVAASLTGYWADAENRVAGFDENPYNIATGLVVGYGGFEVGGSFGFGDNSAEDEFQVYDLGVGYSTGPWSVSLTGIYSEADLNATNSEDELLEGNVGVNYALGTGVSVFATGSVGEVENGAASASNDYVTLLSGVGVSF